MANPATLSDVEDRFHRALTDRELVNVKFWLQDAWWLLTGRLPALEDNITAELVPVENVRRVVVSMIHRMLKNPDGLTRESIDDYSYSRSANVASGALTVEDYEISQLIPGGRSRVATRRLVAYGEYP
jgi:hypothetical protein